MKITWLGQAGLLFDNGKTKIMIDPYLSNSVEKYEPKNYRRVPVKEVFLSVTPDVMIFTHDHLDHYDPETAPVFLRREEKRMTVLAPASVWKKARQEGGHPAKRTFQAIRIEVNQELHVLEQAIDALDTDEGVEDVARQKLGWVADGEIVFYDMGN